jgi:hypothetical protein
VKLGNQQQNRAGNGHRVNITRLLGGRIRICVSLDEIWLQKVNIRVSRRHWHHLEVMEASGLGGEGLMLCHYSRS